MADPTPYFEEARKELRGKYWTEPSDHSAEMRGEAIFQEHILTFLHNKFEVRLSMDFGLRERGTVFCQLPIRPDYFFFSIQSNSPWQQLLLRKKPLEIECENPSVIEKIEESQEFVTLSQMAKKVKFEPEFNGNNRAHGFEIHCSFHLKFDEQGEVIIPIVNFYKRLIDIFSHRS